MATRGLGGSLDAVRLANVDKDLGRRGRCQGRLEHVARLGVYKLDVAPLLSLHHGDFFLAALQERPRERTEAGRRMLAPLAAKTPRTRRANLAVGRVGNLLRIISKQLAEVLVLERVADAAQLLTVRMSACGSCGQWGRGAPRGWA